MIDNHANEIRLEGGVGHTITAGDVRRALDDPTPLRIVLNSGGGVAWDARAIYHAMRDRPVTVHIEFAASAAVTIALGADWRTIAPDGRMMIHRATGIACGGAAHIARAAEYLADQDRQQFEQIAERTRMTVAEIEAALGESGELWMDADDALRLGFVHAITPGERGTVAPGRDPERIRLLAAESLLRQRVEETSDDAAAQRSLASRAVARELDPALAAAALAVEAEVSAAVDADSAGTLRNAETYLVRHRQGLQQALAAARKQLAIHDAGGTASQSPIAPRWTCQDCGAINYHDPGDPLALAACFHCHTAILGDRKMIQQTIAKLLGRVESLTAADCKARMADIATRLQEIESRQADIGYGPGGYQEGQVPGPIRLAAATTGTPADLIALDAEMRELEAEDESLHIQRDELKKAMAAAELRNAPLAAAAAIKALPKALKALEAAKAAHDAALAELDVLRNTITINRRAAEAGNIECPAVSPELFETLADALGLVPATSTPVYAENVRVTRQTLKIAMTGIKPEMPPEPATPWQEMERRRQGEARARELGYLQDTKGPLADRFKTGDAG